LVQKELLTLLRSDPKDILALRLYHFNQIFLGLDKNYLNNHLQILKKWNEKDEFYPLVLGMVSYALEESNNYIDAEFYAKKIVKLYENNNTIIMVHENFRWQTPIITLKKPLTKYNLGTPIYSKISFRHSNPVGYINQKYLYNLKEYLILDVDIHLYDIARLFMGEAISVYTINQNTNKKFKEETAFTSLLKYTNKTVSIVDASISTINEPDRFAQTLINIECKKRVSGIRL